MIQVIIDRLKAAAPGLAAVLPAEELDLITKGTAPRHGTVFVLPFREAGEENQRATGGFRQLVHVQFLTALVTRRHDDARGGAKVTQSDALKAEVEAALAGWAPYQGSALVELVAGKVASLGNGASIDVRTWQTTRTIKRTP